MTTPLCFSGNLFKKKLGIGIDAGSSCFKIVYTTEEDDKVYFNFIRFPASDYTKVFDFLQQTCGHCLECGTEIEMCGVTANELNQAFRDTLGVMPNNTSEFKHMVDGFLFLHKNVAWRDFIINPSQSAMDIGIAKAKKMLELMENFATADSRHKISDPQLCDIPEKLMTPPEGLTYPVIMTLFGSDAGSFPVHENGDYHIKRWNPMGGRAFLGLGSYITGTKDFSELHAMVEQGDHTQVDQMLGHQAGDTSDTVYGQANKAAPGADALIFSFGNLAKQSRDDVKKEDVLAALLNNIVHGAARESCLMADNTNSKQVFYVGSMGSGTDTIRDMITVNHVYETYGQGKGHINDHYFVRHGSYIGAIGALLANLGLVEHVEG